MSAVPASDMPLSTRNLDRLSLRRKDPAWIEERWSHPDTLVTVVWRGRVAADGPLAPDDVAAHVGPEAPVLLGDISGVTRFSVDLSHLEESAIPFGLRFSGLREVATRVPEDDANLLAMATGLAIWHSTHRFCGACGGPTVSQAAGHERRCTSCELVHFPRTDPAVIMLIHDGERCLLGRQAAWPTRMYSTLAGFVEPGESLEDAVRREVSEEAGIRVGVVTYVESQPWPFPRSIMLGFLGVAESTTISVDDNELAEAKWFTAEDLRDGAVMIPPPFAISTRLINTWLATQPS